MSDALPDSKFMSDALPDSKFMSDAFSLGSDEFEEFEQLMGTGEVQATQH